MLSFDELCIHRLQVGLTVVEEQNLFQTGRRLLDLHALEEGTVRPLRT